MKISLVCAFFLFAVVAMVDTCFSAEDEPHWGYDGAEGPDNWGDLTEEFDLCRRGSNQPPIDLVAELDVEMPPLEFDYLKRGALIEENTGH